MNIAVAFVLVCGAVWLALGAMCWPAFVYVTARIAGRRAQRRAERAAWDQLRREGREADRRWKHLMRDIWGRRVKPSPIAISFHSFDDELAALKLIDRTSSTPSPEQP